MVGNPEVVTPQWELSGGGGLGLGCLREGCR